MHLVRSVSLFTITGEEQGKILTENGGLFDTVTYSRFKYGDQSAAMSYGKMLAGAILECESFQSAKSKPQDVVITASAYKSLPTAAQAVANATVDALDEVGFAVSCGRIHRDVLTEGDYGSMSADERAYWMSSNGLWVENSEFVARDVVVIDDVNISGAHARSVVSLFETINIRSLTLVHVLKLSPELAERDPKIEDRMNHSLIKNLHDLELLIRDSVGYAPNARTVKFVLSQPPDAIEAFLRRLPFSVLAKIHAGVQADEYDRMRSYEKSAMLIEVIYQESLIAIVG